MKIRLVGADGKTIEQEISESCFEHDTGGLTNVCEIAFHFKGCIDLDKIQLLMCGVFIFSGKCNPVHRHEKVIFPIRHLRLQKC